MKTGCRRSSRAALAAGLLMLRLAVLVGLVGAGLVVAAAAQALRAALVGAVVTALC